MDYFQEKTVSPMLIAQMQDPFNDPDWIYELKLDGCRCVAYLDSTETTLRNKRNLELLPRFPELKEIHRQVKERCILDGELVVLKNGVPDFYELQRRTILTDPFKIKLEAMRFPASFVAYDFVYMGTTVIMGKTLMERKKLLSKTVIESERLAISRYVEEKGIELFQLADQRELEGVVAKRKDSLYYPGKRTKDWIKFKRMEDEDFVICGYLPKENGKTSLILGKFREGKLICKGHISTGVSREDASCLKNGKCPFNICPSKYKNAVWCIPDHIGVVEYMPNTKNALRQSSFKGFRDDIQVSDVMEDESYSF